MITPSGLKHVARSLTGFFIEPQLLVVSTQQSEPHLSDAHAFHSIGRFRLSTSRALNKRSATNNGKSVAFPRRISIKKERKNNGEQAVVSFG